jgi:hypothetical protein
MYVCVCIYIYIYICMCVYIYIQICMITKDSLLYATAKKTKSSYIHIYMYRIHHSTFLYICLYIYIYKSIDISIHISLCIYIYIYICIYTYIYIRVHIYKHLKYIYRIHHSTFFAGLPVESAGLFIAGIYILYIKCGFFRCTHTQNHVNDANTVIMTSRKTALDIIS